MLDLVESDSRADGRACLRAGAVDIAMDFFRISYRTEIARIVADMHAGTRPALQVVRPWSLGDIWAGWAARSMYHRARREGLEGVEFFSDLDPESPECLAQGHYWLDCCGPTGAVVRVLMPDAFMHVHTELARNKVVRDLLPDLIQGLRELGQLEESARHQAELGVFQLVSRSI